MNIKKCRICGFVPKDDGIDIFHLYDDVFGISHICHTGSHRNIIPQFPSTMKPKNGASRFGISLTRR